MQSIAVSVQTLCAIALERYFAILQPLKYHIKGRTLAITVFAIWIISTGVALPSAIFPKLQKTFDDPDFYQYLTFCNMDPSSKSVYFLFMTVALYLVPMLFIGVFYAIISHYLWHVQVPGASCKCHSAS